jgi:hypothetical protein
MIAGAMLIATIEPDHTIKVPKELPVGEKVVIVRIPSIHSLLQDPDRHERFAATRAAIQNAIRLGYPSKEYSDEELVSLVKRARKGA